MKARTGGGGKTKPWVNAAVQERGKYPLKQNSTRMQDREDSSLYPSLFRRHDSSPFPTSLPPSDLPTGLAVCLDFLQELGEPGIGLQNRLPRLPRLRTAHPQLGGQRVGRLSVEHPIHDNLGLKNSWARKRIQWGSATRWCHAILRSV